jgi:hypothetical protein
LKTFIYAWVVAKPVSFPEVVEVEYQCIDGQDHLIGENYQDKLCSWEEAQRQYLINSERAKECESHLLKGEVAFLGNWAMTGMFYGKGDLRPPPEHDSRRS